MLSREFCIALLEEHDDLIDGLPLERAYDAMIIALGWGGFTDEALAIMATELIRISGVMPEPCPAVHVSITSQRRH